MSFDITTATPQQIVDRDGRGRALTECPGRFCTYHAHETGNSCAVGDLLPEPVKYAYVFGDVTSLVHSAAHAGDHRLVAKVRLVAV